MKYAFSRIGAILLFCLLLLIPARTARAVTYPVVVSISNGASSTILPEIWGVNLQAYLDLGGLAMTSAGNFITYLNGPTLTQSLGIKVIRFPGGGAASAYNWGGGTGNAFLDLGATQPPFMKITDGLSLSGIFGAQMLYQANLTQLTANCTELERIVSFPAHWNGTQSFIRYIELGHDQSLSMNPATYQQIVNTCAHAIKNLDPTIKIGLVGYPSLDESPNSFTQRTAWNMMLAATLPDPSCGLTNTVPCYDFVTDHIYPRVLHASYIPPFLGQATFYSTTNMDLTSPNPINAATPLNPIIIGQSVRPGTPVAFTEWNLECENYAGQLKVDAIGTVEHGLFTALTIFNMVEGGVRLAAFHNLTIDGTFSTESGCGLLTRAANTAPGQPPTLSAAGQAFSLTSIAAGGTLLNAGVGTHNSLLTIPDNTACTSRDCLDIGTNGLAGISNLKAHAIRQGNDMYIFLINRDFNPTNLFDATINYNPFINFTPTVNITATYLIGADYRNTVFQTQAVTLCNPVPCNPGQVVVPVPGASIARVRIENFFLNAPQPTPTPIIPPGTNITEIIRMLNSKRPPVKECVPEIFPYVFACVIYIMVTRLAIEISEWWKQVTLVGCFVMGGVFGYFLCNMTAGFMFGMIMSLFLW